MATVEPTAYTFKSLAAPALLVLAAFFIGRIAGRREAVAHLDETKRNPTAGELLDPMDY